MGRLTKAAVIPHPFPDLFDDGPVTVLRWDAAPGWPLTYVSGAARGLFGRPPEALVGASFADLIAPVDRDRVVAEVAAALEHGAERLRCEPFRLRRDTGAPLWISLHPRVDRDATGVAVCFTATAFDVSEREEALRRERLKASQIEKTVTELSALKAALDRHALVSVGDAKGRIIYANPKFCEASGYSVEELFGAPHSIFNSRTHPPEFFADLWRTIRRGEIWQGEIANRRRDGSIFWVATTILPIRKPHSDDPDRFVAIRTDITHLKEQNDLLKSALDRAEAADRAKSMFLAQMSHEVRTPLNAILGFSELMTLQPYGALADGYHDALDSVLSAGRHLKDLIDEVLDLASVEAGSLDLAVEPVAVPALLRDCVALVAPLAEQQGARVRLDLTNSVMTVPGDARRLRQMVLNLLTNALKYAGDGTIELDAEVATAPVVGLADPARDALCIRVRDHGPGIPLGEVERLLQPFERGTRDPLRSQPAGVGLGLPLTRRLAGLHGGDLILANHPGGGLVARIVLPLDPVSANPVVAAG